MSDRYIAILDAFKVPEYSIVDTTDGGPITEDNPPHVIAVCTNSTDASTVVTALNAG
jgi:hypothetical protein